VALRIVSSSAPVPLQRSFAGFLPVTVVVVDYRRKTGGATCRAPRPRPEQLALSMLAGGSVVARAPAAPAFPPGPIRPPALRAFVPRRSMPGARPRSLGTKAISLRAAREAMDDIRDLAAAGIYEITPDGEVELGPLFPRTYPDDCDEMAPRELAGGAKGWCPFVSCRLHLKYDVDDVTGALKDMHPDKELWEMEETCTLRWVEAHRARAGEAREADQTLPEVGRALNVTMESVRLTAEDAMAKVRRRVNLRDIRRPRQAGEDEE